MKAIAETPHETVETYLKFVARHGSAPGYVNPARWLLDHGQRYETHAPVPRRMRGRRKECYSNAGRLALMLSHLTYVEGYVLVCGIPIEHAWLADVDGRILEVTIPPKELGDVSGYFGAPIDTETLRETASRTKVWGVLGWTNRQMYKEKST